MANEKLELTKGQLAIWQMEQFAGGSVANICGCILYDAGDTPDTARMISAAKKLYKINEALRIKIITENQRVFQIITDDIPDVDFCSFDSKQSFEQFADTWAKEQITTHTLCIMKVIDYPQARGLLVKLHHIIGDAWSLTVLGTQFSALLNGEVPQTGTSYADYISHDTEYWQGERAEKDLLYYEQLYTQNDEILLLSDRQSTDYSAARITYTISKELTKKIYTYIENSHFSILPFFLLTYSIYFSRINLNANHMYIGTTVLNRTRKSDKNMVGMMVNPLPVPVTIHPEQSFEENMSVAQDSVFSLMRHGRCTYNAIIERLRQKQPDLSQLYDVTVNYQNARIHDEHKGFTTVWFGNGMQTDTLQIHIEDHSGTDQLHIHYDFRKQLLSAEDILQLHEASVHIMENAVNYSDISIAKMPIMSSAEINRLTNQFTPVPVLPYDTISEWFNHCAASWPDRVCVETNEKLLTYRQLFLLANQLIGQFSELKIHPGDIVALSVRRKWYLPVAFIACCLYGVTFVPVDPDLPEDRIQFMLVDSNAKLNLDDELLQKLLQPQKMADLRQISPALNEKVYCIYTSGSTGKPKGVMISQKNLLNNIAWRTSYYHKPNVNVVNVCNITADTFWEDLSYSLFSGSRFCLVENYRDLEQIGNMVTQHDHVMLMTTPTYFSTIIQKVPIDSFEQVILVGESIDRTLANKILKANVSLFNEYGPSECTICTTCTRITTLDIHIGRPINGAGVYILDQYLQPVPPGALGELCVAGRGVGMGYLNRPSLTAKHFVNDPFHGGTMYRTGDIARWRPDMNICFVGRNDNQCKIRGLRVELDEIEKHLSNIDGIEKAAVVVRKKNNGNQMICAFYTGSSYTVHFLRQQLAKFLPQHMVPHIFRHLEHIHLTANGKINKRALPAVDLEQINVPVQFQPPENELESTLCDIASQILKVVPYGTNHNFFEHGGDSLKAILFASIAHQKGLNVDVQALFNYPVIKDLSDHILNNTETGQNIPVKEWNTITKQLQQMSWPGKNDEHIRTGPVLLTGATGFLGAHILAELLETTDDDVWCIVRGSSEKNSRERLESVLCLYFGSSFLSAFERRLHVLHGDLTKKMLGLSADQYLFLSTTITCVIHAAANVKHYGPYDEFYRDNVLATSKMIELCQQAHAHLIYISTTSVSGFNLNQHDTAPVFTEHSLYYGQDMSNVYVYSKFQAEVLVLEALHYGLSGCIARMGNLTNRIKDGLFQWNSTTNAFAQRMAAMMTLGAYPEKIKDMHIEFTPVDEAAKAVVLLSVNICGNSVFHIMNPHMVRLSDVAKTFTENGSVLIPLTNEQFHELLHADTEAAQAAREAFVNEIDADGTLQLTGSAQVDCQESVNLLAKYGFQWKKIDTCYIKKYLQFLRQMMKGKRI